MMLTQALIAAACGASASASAAAQPGLQKACGEAGINTPELVAAFLANIGVESAGLTATVENLNYSATGLLATFPSHFTQLEAQQYARKPITIASRAYANRLGNGDEASGDGWRYRGRGYLQVTGKSNYAAAGKALGLDLLAHPELLEQPEGAARSAAWFWSSNKLSRFAGQFLQVCKAINCGNPNSKATPNGYSTRLARYAAAMKLLGA